MIKPKKKLDLSKVRTRYEPPTLEEAIFAAQGLTDTLEHQVEIAARLTGTPESEVKTAALKLQAPAPRGGRMQSAGARRVVVVERRASRAAAPLRARTS